MSRYIDIEPILEWCGDPEVCEPYGINSVELERKLYDAPSIDIVRCKDCKYWVSDGGALMICDIHKDPTVPEHFCSYGEREGE